MWKFMIRVINAAEMRVIVSWFVASTIPQDVTLTLMILFLRALYAHPESLTGWLVTVVALGVITFVVDAITVFRSYRVSVFEVCDTMVNHVAEHVLALPLDWFNTKRETAVVNTISEEVNIFSHLCSMIIPNLCNAFVVSLVMLMVIGTVGWPLALIMAIAIVPLCLVWRIVHSTTTRANETEDQAVTTAAGWLVEFARLQPMLWATGASEKGWKPVQEVLEAGSETTSDGLRIKGRPGQFFTLILNATFAVVLALGLSFVSGYRLDVVAHLAITTVVTRMLLPLTKGVPYASEADNTVVALKAIVSILDTKSLPESSPEQVEEPKGIDIVPRDISFSYEEGQPVLDGMSLTAEQGRATALVGPSGAGKLTVLRLAARFWDVTTGTVSIGGVDVRHLPTVGVMAMMSMIFREVYLFDATIRKNLRIARPDITDEELEGAVRRTGLDKVVEALPHGWDAPVGPGGMSLSGEERQQVSIAWTFLEDVPVLLLGEITSALGGENESAVTEVIRKLSRRRAALAVAYQLSTIRQADQVVFLEPSPDGTRVTRAGTVPGLTAQEGPFRGFVEACTATSRWQL